MAKIQDIDIPYLEFAEAAAPGTPAAGIVRTYSKTDGLMYSKDDAGVETLMSGGGGSLTDHTHATTGSGAAGGGNALDVNAGSLRIPVGTGSLTTTEGHVGWQSTTELLRVYDGQRERSVTEVGWAPRAFPLNWVGTIAAATSETLAANGGSVAVPILVSGHLLLHDVAVRSLDTATERTWGWDLYAQRLNNGNGAENTLDRVAASSANETFTPSGASSRVITASGGPIYLGPGLYWLVVQNRHATNSFALAYTAAGSGWGGTVNQVKTTTNPNGATLDFVAATWTKNSNIYAVCLRGRVFGDTGAF